MTRAEGASFAARVVTLFRAHPNEWIPSTTIERHGGRCAWRTRISDARRPPFNLDIRNRTRRIRRSDGTSFVVSEYLMVSGEQGHAAPIQIYERSYSPDPTDQTSAAQAAELGNQ